MRTANARLLPFSPTSSTCKVEGATRCAMALNLTEIPNPLTPYALLPPDIASQVQIGSYILVGTLGAFIWDILTHLKEDYRLLFQCRISVSTVVYFFSRLWSLLFILGGSMFQTYPLKHCALSQTLVESCFAIAVPLTSLLFFLRARAIFNRNPWLNVFLFSLWLSVAGTCATAPTAIHAITIGPTPYCINTGVKSYVGSTAITPLLHDTSIFLAISWRLYMNSHSRDVRTFVTGKSLPSFSRALLKDGQLYYLITVTSNALAVAMFYNTRVAPTYRVMFSITNVAVTNSMGCSVFRNTKFGYHERVTSTLDIMSSTRPSNSLGGLAFGSAYRSSGGAPQSRNTENGENVGVDVAKIQAFDVDDSAARDFQGKHQHAV
ncbi:hypothetical protein HMN09_01350600 [Mycena chlorophos]|uniref:Uncharacterized protein n=1 Tax=Mycena chlorophos TaxID=658473 RepID=A0A8H6RY50_MYCCL|nr:hypothetical protein HMN09_01350600 [Mycena chlorophos]